LISEDSKGNQKGEEKVKLFKVDIEEVPEEIMANDYDDARKK